MVDGFAKVGGLLVGFVDDLGLSGFEVATGFGGQTVEIADDDTEVVLGGGLGLAVLLGVGWLTKIGSARLPAASKRQLAPPSAAMRMDAGSFGQIRNING